MQECERFYLGENPKEFREKGDEVNEGVCLGVDNDDGDWKRIGIVLVGDSGVAGEQALKSVGRRPAHQCSVLRAMPTEIGHGENLVTSEEMAEVVGEIFVEQYLHQAARGVLVY